MGLNRQSKSNTIFLQVKHNSLWQELKAPVEGCDMVEVTNPSTKQVMKKYGYKYRDVSGRVFKLEKYDRSHDGKRYFGFKLYLRDGDDSFSIDMPYQSQFLRRFLRVIPNINWYEDLSIAVFKGKGKEGKEELGVWFQQGGETIRAYYTRESPNGLPQPKQDPDTKEWDFREQHRWLVDRLKAEAIPAVEEAERDRKARYQQASGVEPDEQQQHDEPEPTHDTQPFGEVTDDDVPF